MFSPSKSLLIIACFHCAIAENEYSAAAPSNHDDIQILANIVSLYTAKIHKYNRQLITIEYSADNFEQTRRQMDLLQAILASTNQQPVTYVVLDLNVFRERLHSYRGLSLMFVDSSRIFR